MSSSLRNHVKKLIFSTFSATEWKEKEKKRRDLMNSKIHATGREIRAEIIYWFNNFRTGNDFHAPHSVLFKRCAQFIAVSPLFKISVNQHLRDIVHKIVHEILWKSHQSFSLHLAESLTKLYFRQGEINSVNFKSQFQFRRPWFT